MITAGQETITLRGRKLATIRDALNAGRLLEVTVTANPTAGDYMTGNETAVSEIRFAVVE